MEKPASMTALISAFARAWHTENNAVCVFEDPVARQLLTGEEYRQIGENMAQGVHFFLPGFEGTPEQALRRVMDTRLAPTPLGRAAFAGQALQTAATIGTRQVLILAAGYDTFAYCQPDWAAELHIFEVDRPEMIRDKCQRLQRAGIPLPDNLRLVEADLTDPEWMKALTSSGFSSSQTTFCSLLGLIYYLPETVLELLLKTLGDTLPEGSTLVFDYPDESYGGQHSTLAAAAGEAMAAGYSCSHVTELLSRCGFRIYEHLTPDEITEQYFALYNRAHPGSRMVAQPDVNYCLSVRK